VGYPESGMLPLRASVIGLVATAVVGCGSHIPPLIDEDLPPSSLQDGGPDSGGFFNATPPPPPAADAAGYCGNVIVPIVLERPNLYFVLDASGSMISPMDVPDANGNFGTRYDAARAAIADVLKVVGHRVSYGAATFPATDSDSDTSQCPAGQEVFATRPGDPVSYAIADKVGPILSSLLATLAGRTPSGLTPTAATMMGLQNKLLALTGKTYAFLLTDGAPNCDANITCDTNECTTNIEGNCDPNDATLNCCDLRYGAQQNLWCLDAEPTVSAVANLEASGIKTFVIGMPGSTVYAGLLDQLAEAGGTARPTEPYYYPAEGADDLAATLRQIGLSVSISCEVTLATAPPDPALVNVYFDKTVVPFDPTDGWTYIDPTHVGIEGKSCALLQGGDVLDVQVVAGCTSIVN